MLTSTFVKVLEGAVLRDGLDMLVEATLDQRVRLLVSGPLGGAGGVEVVVITFGGSRVRPAEEEIPAHREERHGGWDRLGQYWNNRLSHWVHVPARREVSVPRGTVLSLEGVARLARLGEWLPPPVVR